MVTSRPTRLAQRFSLNMSRCNPVACIGSRGRWHITIGVFWHEHEHYWFEFEYKSCEGEEARVPEVPAGALCVDAVVRRRTAPVRLRALYDLSSRPAAALGTGAGTHGDGGESSADHD